MRRTAALALAAVLMTGSAHALFGRKQAEPEDGAPEVQDLELTTYQDIAVEGTFQAAGAGQLTYAVAEEPEKGTVAAEGQSFTYTPRTGAVGTDRFTYTAADEQGRTSRTATVTVRIERCKSGVRYADTQDSKAALAAQQLAEAGVFTGAKIGEQYYFEPDKTVSRGEFLALVMETADRPVTSVTMTGFCDDASIPTWAKAYAAAGVAEGIVQGRTTGEGAAFQAGDPITFNEAATVLNRVLDLGDVELDVWYADREEVPSWAAQAVGNMEAVNVLAAGSFGSGAMERAVTRADAAQMLSAAKTLLDGEKTGGGLFGWLK